MPAIGPRSTKDVTECAATADAVGIVTGASACMLLLASLARSGCCWGEAAVPAALARRGSTAANAANLAEPAGLKRPHIAISRCWKTWSPKAGG